MVLRLQWITQEHPSGNFSDQVWQTWLRILLPDCHVFYHMFVLKIWQCIKTVPLSYCYLILLPIFIENVPEIVRSN